MAEEKETRPDELKDLDPKKDPKGGAKQPDGRLGVGRGEVPRLDKP
jgi:hypothetical protein